MTRLREKPVRLVVFDCDGTLVDGQFMILAAMATAFKRAGLAAPPDQAVRRLVGVSLGQTMAELAPDAEQDLRDALRRHYADAFGELRRDGSSEPLYPGAAAALARLDAAGFLIGLATGKSRRGVDHALGQYSLLGHFVTIQTGDQGPGKPHPAMLERAMAEAGAEPDETLVVGDTTFDIEMAVAAGATGLGVDWGYHEPGELLAAGATAVIDTFDALDRFTVRG